MPRRKKTIIKRKENSRPKGLSDSIYKLRMSESYASLFLGFAVVILIVIIGLAFLRGKRHTATSSISTQIPAAQIEQTLHPTQIAQNPTVTTEPTITPNPTAKPSPSPIPSVSVSAEKTIEMGGGMYTVKDGDTLWDIAQNQLGSGFLWHNIASSNNISDPLHIKPGDKIGIPKIENKQVAGTSTQAGSGLTGSSINSNTYTAVHGDTLWDIAVRRYGDGFRWVDIAKLNNLKNPNLIFSGNVFQLSPS